MSKNIPYRFTYLAYFAIAAEQIDLFDIRQNMIYEKLNDTLIKNFSIFLLINVRGK